MVLKLLRRLFGTTPQPVDAVDAVPIEAPVAMAVVKDADPSGGGQGCQKHMATPGISVIRPHGVQRM